MCRTEDTWFNYAGIRSLAAESKHLTTILHRTRIANSPRFGYLKQEFRQNEGIETPYVCKYVSVYVQTAAGIRRCSRYRPTASVMQ